MPRASGIRLTPVSRTRFSYCLCFNREMELIITCCIHDWICRNFVYRRKPKEGEGGSKIREKNITCARLEINGSFISNTIITDFLTGTKGFSHVRSIGDILTAGGCKLCRFDLLLFLIYQDILWIRIKICHLVAFLIEACRNWSDHILNGDLQRVTSHW